MRQWRFIREAPHDYPPLELARYRQNGAWNMAVDDVLLSQVASENSSPILRLYAWSPPCLSLGYGQKESDVDLARALGHGWDVVRRPTGGRAILHTDELTYSIALPADHPLANLDIVESYRQISRALTYALELLGAQPYSERADKSSLVNPGAVCFEIPSHYEITVEGRKLIGSAQMRRHGAVLQHGSLPLEGDLARICDALAYDDEAAREAARGKVRQRAITLSEALTRHVTWDAAAKAVAEGFQTVFGISLEHSELSYEEYTAAEALMSTRYATISRVKSAFVG